MTNRSPRYDLLFGVMALQTQFISHEQLLNAAIRAAANDSAIADELVELGSITDTDRLAIDKLTRARIQHQKSLGAADGDHPPQHSGLQTSSEPPATGAPRTPGMPPTTVRGEPPTRWMEQLPTEQFDDIAGETLMAIGVNESAFMRPKGRPEASDESILETVRSLFPRRPGRDTPAPTEAVVLTRQKADRYQTRREVARGGLGRILLVSDSDCHREIAWKELIDSPTADEASFLQEARITAQLEHPNIVPVYELGVGDSGKPYYTMRFIKGRPMTDLIREMARERKAREKPDPVADALARMRLLTSFQGTCQAVAYAHSKGVIHRDIKPANVMVGDFGEVLLVDWGLAKVRGRQAEDETGNFVQPLAEVPVDGTVDGTIAGTPAYMSPEQASGKVDAIDWRTDIYSLGAMLYEILTHQIPFRGPHALAVLQDVRAGNVVPPRERAPQLQIPATLDEITMRAMAPEPADRYQTVEELAEAVTLFIEGSQEREKMHERAGARVAEARILADEYWQLREQCTAAGEKLEELKDEIVGYEPIETKQTLWDAEASFESLRHDAVEAWNTVIRAYNECLGFEPDNPTASADLADLYWRRFREAEDGSDEADKQQAPFYRSQVEFHDTEGRYSTALIGNGSLTIRCDHPKASVALGRNVEVDRTLRTIELQPLGTVEGNGGLVEVRPLSMGSWHALLECPGCRRVDLPIRVGRQQELRMDVKLVPADYLHEEFDVPADREALPDRSHERGRGERWVQVPAGEFIYGDHTAPSGKKPETRFEDDFFIARTPVTAAEYLAFLNDLHNRDPKAAAARQPRQAAEAGFYWVLDADANAYRLPTGDEVDRYDWKPRWPVMGINWHDAEAWCQWYGTRHNVTCTLPTAVQWEKAARGPDARSYPWGNREDSTWLNCGQTREEGAEIMPVGSFPIDRSPYGVLDMAGNVGDWCVDDVGEKYPGWKNIRGGYWTQTVPMCKVGAQRGYTADALFFYIGFRPVILPASS